MYVMFPHLSPSLCSWYMISNLHPLKKRRICRIGCVKGTFRPILKLRYHETWDNINRSKQKDINTKIEA